MSEEKNIEETNSEVGNLKYELQADPTHLQSLTQHETQNTEPETVSMEVHKHPHHVTRKKKWGEYLLEFFMLFLAVFLGFVAENYREHIVEGKKEKEYMRSLIADLHTDTVIINTANRSTTHHSNDDSVFVFLLRTHKTDSATVSKLSNLYPGTRIFDVKINESKTFEQLKSTGDFRIIKNKKVQDSISEYYQKIAEFKIWRDEIQSNLLASYNFSYKVLDNYGLNNQLPSSPYITTNQQDITEYSNKLYGQILDFKRYTFNLMKLKKQAISLCDVIEKEYHLENE
ncbi:MAG: hypothetical protein ABIT07_13160 [Ferruginibacter sp.]